MKSNFSFEQFKNRHIGPDVTETQEMVNFIGGAKDLDELIDQTIPENIRMQKAMNIPNALTEFEMLSTLKKLANKNKVNKSYIGMGYYNTIVPGVILRNILENPGWYTQYTPYQAEIAQGRLEALLNYQTLVCELTGMEIANASLLDEATAAAEAMAMLYAQRPKNRGNKFYVSSRCFPQTLDVLLTRSEPMGIEIVSVEIADFTPTDDCFGVFFQYPDGHGMIQDDYERFTKLCKENGIGVAVAADIMSLVLLSPPGSWGADVVVGSAQRFGVPMGYGGPHAAFFATKDANKRSIPGRIIGVSVDAQGNRALRMALQTREQHIRREKATSNICTAQVLLAIMSGMYAVYHGPHGLKQIAMRINSAANTIHKGLLHLGYEVGSKHYFDTLMVKVDAELKEYIEKHALEANINLNYFVKGHIGIAADETTSVKDVKKLLEIFAAAVHKKVSKAEVEQWIKGDNASIASMHLRTDNILEQEVFNKYHSETEMLRYIKKLESRDLSLAFSMISLGSCTMKLNATTEMIPVTWPQFSDIHPFAPIKQAKGYHKMFKQLEQYLCAVTGFDAVSLQPNAGAQGEYAGLMVIREYFRHINQGHRNIAIIPESAHGTNPASAVMAGMKVVVVKCDEMGNIDVADLKAKALQHSQNLACLMVTYPSTHGVFEDAIVEICSLIHSLGGQVYMDGANMNAQVGLTSPALIGADVCHLNLHKTFCIPHGGGGPGMGPIGVAKHLAEFLPSHSVIKIGGHNAMRAVSAAPYGSASILLISYVYIRMMGAQGLTEATKYAILNANYIKVKLQKDFKILYTGKNGRAAHEMIVDLRDFKRTAHVEVEDIAKRLMDYGFHAPTVSFPVAGTVMIEPTESENRHELDKFCEALLSIKKEIGMIENGIYDHENNPLKNAPHTAAVALAENWNYPYSRETAVYPAPWVKESKFWPFVARVNNTHGDRNLVCTCEPISSYVEE